MATPPRRSSTAIARTIIDSNDYMALAHRRRERAAVGLAGVVRAGGVPGVLLGLVSRGRGTRATSPRVRSSRIVIFDSTVAVGAGAGRVHVGRRGAALRRRPRPRHRDLLPQIRGAGSGGMDARPGRFACSPSALSSHGVGALDARSRRKPRPADTSDSVTVGNSSSRCRRRISSRMWGSKAASAS